MSKSKLKEFMVALTIISCVCITVVMLNYNKLTSNANTGLIIYATFTNALSNNKLELTNRGSYGKVSSTNGKIGFWLYASADDYKSNKVDQKGMVVFKNDGTWAYSIYKNDKNILKTSGKGKFDLQSILVMNKTSGYLNVKFYKGDYNVYNFYRVYSNTLITGEGQGVSKLYKMNNSPTFITFDDTFAKVKQYNGTKNVTIRMMTIDCYAKDVDKMYKSCVLFAAHGEKLLINNVSVVNGLASHALQLTSMKNVTVRDCVFSKNDYVTFGDSYTHMNYTYCKQNQLTETNAAFNNEVIQIESDVCGDSSTGVVYSCPTARLSRDDTPSYQIYIKNNKFYRVVRAIGNHSHRSTNYQTHILIQGNTFDTVLADTIRFPKYKDFSIKENYFKAISSTYVGGQRIRIIKSVNKENKKYTDLEQSAKKLWASQNYYFSSSEEYKLISSYKSSDNYKITIQ
ncbi:MAG: hypothetical protein E7262_01880 [Lachnospiraceae bacterium]|nr:hypothetical protein [Lachnospiraceae bacterium]